MVISSYLLLFCHRVNRSLTLGLLMTSYRLAHCLCAIGLCPFLKPCQTSGHALGLPLPTLSASSPALAYD